MVYCFQKEAIYSLGWLCTEKVFSGALLDAPSINHSLTTEKAIEKATSTVTIANIQCDNHGVEKQHFRQAKLDSERNHAIYVAGCHIGNMRRAASGDPGSFVV